MKNFLLQAKLLLYPDEVGKTLRKMYEAGEIRNENEFEEALKMCYLIAKNKKLHGCIVLKTRHGSHLVEMKRRMNQQVASKGVQVVTISRPREQKME